MKIKYFILIIVIILIYFPLCSAEHYIIGFIEDAKDGTDANGHTIILWNPNLGIQDNLSDIVGPTGNSNAENKYSIECESLSTPCQVNDILSVKVINNGDDYISYTKNVTVTLTSEDYVDNITLNSPPNTSIIYPLNYLNISNSEVNFNCSVYDLDDNLKEISLYGNWTGEWKLNETKEISFNEGFKIFTKILSQGFYKYACSVMDNLSILSFSYENNSFNVDLTKPEISSVLANLSYSCGNKSITRVNCTSYDSFLNIDKVIIQAITPSKKINYSSSILTENIYYSDILLDETGNWKFNCISNDSAGNSNNMTSGEIRVYSDNPELIINSSSITSNNTNPLEKQIIEISAVVENNGCMGAEEIIIGFFYGNPEISGENIKNSTISIEQLSSNITNISWETKIGPTNIFIVADYGYIISEEDETNNIANKTFSIDSWQDIYGNTSIDKIIGNETTRIKKWFNESALDGNIFVTDSECLIDWSSLQAIGRKKTGEESLNDFYDIDELLGMEYFEDSVSNTFSENQIPKEKVDLIIHQKEIKNIPVINSTNNSNFITGILWDTSDDSEGEEGEFDKNDKEDFVFVARIKKESEGAYGIYDYEIKIPVKLREYINLDSEEIYLYYELN